VRRAQFRRLPIKRGRRPRWQEQVHHRRCRQGVVVPLRSLLTEDRDLASITLHGRSLRILLQVAPR
jgi:hypothetical protein